MVYKGVAGTEEMRMRGRDKPESSIKHVLALETHL